MTQTKPQLKSRAQLKTEVQRAIKTSKSTSEAIKNIELIIAETQFVTLTAKELFNLYA
jgi:hypothetical protein